MVQVPKKRAAPAKKKEASPMTDLQLYVAYSAAALSGLIAAQRDQQYTVIDDIIQEADVYATKMVTQARSRE